MAFKCHIAMKYDKIKVGAALKARRTAQGLTQGQLSELAGISLRSVQRIENGEVNARGYTLQLLQEKLDCQLDESHHLAQDNLCDVMTGKGKGVKLMQNRIFATGAAGAVLFICSSVFLSRSAVFPETDFEAYNFIIGTIFLYSLLLLGIWRKMPQHEGISGRTRNG